MQRRRPSYPLWLWPHLLGLDAPIVALAWHLLCLRASGISFGWREPAALFLSVWAIYLADRSLDARGMRPKGWEPERKSFSRAHPALMASGALLSSCLVIVLAFLSPLVHILFKPLLLLAALVFLYFIAVHIGGPDTPRRWPRELAVSVLFSLGTFLPWLSSARATAGAFLCAVLFALLCWVNTSVIEFDEWRQNRSVRRPGLFARRISARQRSVVFLIASFSCLAYFGGWLPPLLFAAILPTCLLLWVLAVRRGEVSSRVFRVAMDTALCSPLLLLLLNTPA